MTPQLQGAVGSGVDGEPVRNREVVLYYTAARRGKTRTVTDSSTIAPIKPPITTGR